MLFSGDYNRPAADAAAGVSCWLAEVIRLLMQYDRPASHAVLALTEGNAGKEDRERPRPILTHLDVPQISGVRVSESVRWQKAVLDPIRIEVAASGHARVSAFAILMDVQAVLTRQHPSHLDGNL
jgi:hypothetical protein